MAVVCRSLRAMVASPESNNRLLLALTGDLAKHANRLDAVRLLQRILDKYAGNPDPSINVVLLLR